MSNCSSCDSSIQDNNKPKCCDPDSILNILKTNEQIPVKNHAFNFKKNPVYTNLDICVLPKCMASYIISRNTKKILNIIQCNSTWYNRVYDLYVALKMAGEQAGRGRKGCCYKLKWVPCGNTKIISFNQLINLNRFKIRYYKTSNLHYFMNLVLTSYKKIVKAKRFISNNKEYPYNNLVNKNVKQFKYIDETGKYVTKNIQYGKNCKCYNKLDFVNWINYRRIINNNYKKSASCTIGSC